MGSYDTFIDVDGTDVQSKAFGKGLRHYRPGARVAAMPAPMTSEEFDGWLDGSWKPAVPAVGDYQVDANLFTNPDDTQQGVVAAYIDVRNDVFRAITLKRDAAVPLLDSFGRRVEDGTA